MFEEESYPYVSIETRDPEIVAALVKNLRTQQAFWAPYLQMAINDFVCLDDCAMPHCQAVREVFAHIKIVVQIPMPLGLDLVVTPEGGDDH